MVAHSIRKSFTSDRAATVAETLGVDLADEGIELEEKEQRSRSRAADRDIQAAHMWLHFEHQFDSLEERDGVAVAAD